MNTSENVNVEYVELPVSPLSATISMSSGRISSLNSDKSDIGTKTAEKLFSSYQIPLNKMPEELICLLNEGKPLGRCSTDFVHCIVSDMRRTSFYIPQTIFRKVAGQLLIAFPKSVGLLNSEGELICNESVGLATKLLNHNNYLNRTSKGGGTNKPTKRHYNMSEGIPNFYNKDNDANYTNEDAESKRIWLKEHNKLELKNEELRQEVLTVFNNTFAAQRKYLLDNPKMTEIKQNWPHLLEPNFLIYHFTNLLNIEENLFFERWDKLKIKTLEFSKKKKKSEILSKDEDLKILEIITSHFKENLQFMIRQYPVIISLFIN